MLGKRKHMKTVKVLVLILSVSIISVCHSKPADNYKLTRTQSELLKTGKYAEPINAAYYHGQVFIPNRLPIPITKSRAEMEQFILNGVLEANCRNPGKCRHLGWCISAIRLNKLIEGEQCFCRVGYHGNLCQNED